MRVTKNMLEKKIAYINRSTGRPQSGKGSLYLDKLQPGDATRIYKLCEVTQGSLEYTPVRMNGREMLAYLNGIIDALDILPQRKAQMNAPIESLTVNL